MHRVVSLYRTSVGKKVVMALSGLFIIAWLIGHVVGNLKAFLGPDEINHYAEWLREMGAPALPPMVGLWGVRILLLIAVAAHVTAAVQLWRQSAAARAGGYSRSANLVFSRASKTMRVGGLLLLAYIVYHLLHLTVGSAHGDFVPGDVYHNIVSAFRNPVVTGVYTLAMAALALHLYHGIWSLMQTLGLSHPRHDRVRRPIALVLTILIVGGFLAVPWAVFAGLIS